MSLWVPASVNMTQQFQNWNCLLLCRSIFKLLIDCHTNFFVFIQPISEWLVFLWIFAMYLHLYLWFLHSVLRQAIGKISYNETMLSSIAHRPTCLFFSFWTLWLIIFVCFWLWSKSNKQPSFQPTPSKPTPNSLCIIFPGFNLHLFYFFLVSLS